MTELIERLDFLRQNRAYHTWLGGIGVSRDQIADIKNKGKPPNDRTLSALSRCENANIHWLQTGEDSPYIVADVYDDGSCNDLLTELLLDEAWSVYLISDSKGRALLALTLQCSYSRSRGKDTEYTAVEVLPHAGTYAITTAYKFSSVLYKVSVSDEILDQLINGQKSVHALLGDKKTPGILKNSERISMAERQAFEQLENVPKLLATTENNSDDNQLIHDYTLLSEENKKLVRTLVKSLIK